MKKATTRGARTCKTQLPCVRRWSWGLVFLALALGCGDDVERDSPPSAASDDTPASAGEDSTAAESAPVPPADARAVGSTRTLVEAGRLAESFRDADAPELSGDADADHASAAIDALDGATISHSTPVVDGGAATIRDASAPPVVRRDAALPVPASGVNSCRTEFERCITDNQLAGLNASNPALTTAALNGSLLSAVEPCVPQAEQCGLFGGGPGSGAACLQDYQACFGVQPLPDCISRGEQCGLYRSGASACFESFVVCAIDVFATVQCLQEARACGLAPLISAFPGVTTGLP